ncbi:MAG: hypothetical protein H7Y30_01345 [Pyrinomonadaceae bacterium]|nr:hypothetical protein [Pyrinomonadaceae bacterium]
MSDSENTQGPPPLQLDAQGELLTGSVAEVIEWFLNYDPRVAVIRHRSVEQIFQWKQEETVRAGEEVYQFNHAEDRLAIGILQALAENPGERELHGWLSQLLNVLDDAAKTNEEIATAYKLDAATEASPIEEAQKLPTMSERRVYLTCCWLEALCTAEIRVLGWMYQELYGKAYAP